MKEKRSVQLLVSVAMLSGVAFVMMYFDFPLPMFPDFLKIDFSEVPALIGGILFGPAAGVMIELIKNVLHYVFKSAATGVPIGQLGNFIAGSLFVISTVVIYRKWRTWKALIFGMLTGTVVMAVGMAFANYFILIPAYAYFLDMGFMNDTKFELILYAISPFNFFKGLIIAVIAYPLMIKLIPKIKVNSLRA
ncbi:ECF transporter S component [Rubeoparvulum massiliense]|uniref:ECF transporter S component n=1 Tax=Rubeoparvulum massiliense TaxID=1631346 RepID=UPI00065DEEF8|nr:ECF transporter S component [Rubeoparvulum massiliense]